MSQTGISLEPKRLRMTVTIHGWLSSSFNNVSARRDALAPLLDGGLSLKAAGTCVGARTQRVPAHTKLEAHLLGAQAIQSVSHSW